MTGESSMMDIPRLIRTQITSAEMDPPQELATALNSGSTPLSDVVKGLGPYLTSTEDDVRLKGLTFLSNLVRTMQPNRINRPATQTLTSFFLSKLDDFDSLPPTLQALTVLSKLPTFDDGAAEEVYRGIVAEVKLKSYAQATRHLVYDLLDSLLASHRKALKDMGADFLNSYTQLVDGEKDPRNLLLLFAMDRVILLEFDVSAHIEDIFDVTFCYFPIMFKPPPNDPYGITAEDLKIALRQCMSASPLFAKMAIPLFLEKFSTAAGTAMRDLMQSMAQCFPVYGAAAVGERSKELWEGIKTEIMYSSDATIEAAALSALESLIRTMYPTKADTPSGLAQDIIKECLEILQEEKATSLAATKVLAALIRASPSAGPFAISQALPQLFRQFDRPVLPTHRSAIIGAIGALAMAASTVYAKPESGRRFDDEKSLDSCRGSLMDVMREGLRTDDLRNWGILGSVAMIEIPGFLSASEAEDLIRGMNEILIHDDDEQNRSAVIKGLTAVSARNAQVIDAVTLPLLFHNLPDQAPSISAVEERESYRRILNSLSDLCIQPSLFETLVVRVTTKLELLSQAPTQSTTDVDMSTGDGADVDDRECNVAFAYDLLQCLATVLDSKIKEKHVDVVKYFDKIIPRLYSLVISAAGQQHSGPAPFFQDRRLLSIIGRITETLMWELSADRQAKQLSSVYDAFEKVQMSGIVHDPATIASQSASPLRPDASTSELNLIAVYSSTIQAIKPDCAEPAPSAEAFLSSKIHWAIHVARDAYQLEWVLDLITAYVNKRVNLLEKTLADVLEMVWVKEVVDTEQDSATRQRGLVVYLHVIKALSLLRHPLAYEGIDRVIAVLKLSNFDPHFVNEAAQGFSVLAQGKGKGKEKTSHLTSRLLFAQKMWNHCLPQLIQGDKEASGRDRLPYLVAFSSLLPLIPASICLSDLPTILPLLLRSLALPDPAQRSNSIGTLISILETPNLSADADRLLHQQASALVDSLLKSTIADPSSGIASSGKVRAAALRGLAVVPEAIRADTLRDIKPLVLKDLGRALDDPVRIVRREGVECRARWYRL